jgi:pilus assembly protein Flp/PilA
MKRLARQIRHLTRSEDGPSTVEYAVMLALIVMVAANAIQTLGCNAKATFSNVANSLGN